MNLSGPVAGRGRSQLGKLMNDAALNTKGTYDPRFRKSSSTSNSSLLRLPQANSSKGLGEIPSLTGVGPSGVE